VELDKIRRQQVLVIYRNSLLAQGIASLLQREKGLEVMVLNLAETGDTPPAPLTPEVIIVDANDPGAQQELSVLRLLRDNPTARVICLHPGDQVLEIYQRIQKMAAKREELIEAIQSPHPRPGARGRLGMNSKLGTVGLALITLLGTVPQADAWPKDLGALAGMIMWILLGLLVLKVLALFAGVH
jgi:hypothetical protein